MFLQVQQAVSKKKKVERPSAFDRIKTQETRTYYILLGYLFLFFTDDITVLYFKFRYNGIT